MIRRLIWQKNAEGCKADVALTWQDPCSQPGPPHVVPFCLERSAPTRQLADTWTSLQPPLWPRTTQIQASATSHARAEGVGGGGRLTGRRRGDVDREYWGVCQVSTALAVPQAQDLELLHVPPGSC